MSRPLRIEFPGALYHDFTGCERLMPATLDWLCPNALPEVAAGIRR